MEHPLEIEAEAKAALLPQTLAKGEDTKKAEESVCINISEENQNQAMREKTYKPELISIGPYYRKEPAGSKNSVKEKFQRSFFGKNGELKERCRKRLRGLEKKARSWYAKNIGLDDINDDDDDEQFGLVEMLLLDGCFILEFFYQMNPPDVDAFKNGVVDEEVAEAITAFMEVDGTVAQTLNDLLFIESQLPFFVLFELHKLKSRSSADDALVNRYEDNDALPASADDNALLQQLVVLVKKSFAVQVPKLTPQNVLAAHEYEPKHLLELVHSLCIPSNTKSGGDHHHHTYGGIIEQINTATELENDGIRLKKMGKVYAGYRDDNAYDATTLFDIDFNWARLKIPCFRIEDYTDTFFRNMVAYEQHPKSDARKYFTDYVWFMGQLMRTKDDVNLLRRRGIIVNLLSTDEEVAAMFNKMNKGIAISTTFSQVYTKVNRFGEKAWYIWFGKLGQDFYYSPWKLITTIVGSLIFSLGTAVSIKNLVK